MYIPTAAYPSVCSTHGDDASTAREPLFLRSIIRNTCARLLLYRPTLDTHVCRGTRAKRNQQQETSTLIANATKKTCDKLLRLRGEGVRVSSLFVGTRQVSSTERGDSAGRHETSIHATAATLDKRQNKLRSVKSVSCELTVWARK